MRDKIKGDTIPIFVFTYSRHSRHSLKDPFSGEYYWKQQRNEPIPPEDLDVPFDPPPEEYLYRCAVCAEELLVNEAIIDAAIGMATFRDDFALAFVLCPAYDAGHDPPVYRMGLDRLQRYSRVEGQGDAVRL